MRGSSVSVVPFISSVVAVSLSFAACSDALHLDPPGATAATSASGSSTSTSGSGTGGHVSHPDGGSDAATTTTCQSNPDCAYPTPVCDTTTNECVQCLVVSDCAQMPGTVCSLGTCQCPAPPSAPLTYCTGETPACVDATTSVDNCGGCGNICYGACTASKCSNGWLAIPASIPGTPSARSRHVAVWTGTQMFVWGGIGPSGVLGDGALYDPVKRSWAPVSSMGAPSPRAGATAVWDDNDNKVIVWGGTAGTAYPQDGGIYDPATDTWTATSIGNNLPGGRVGHSAVWVHALSGFPPSTSGMIIFGGQNATTPDPVFLADGQVFDPSTNAWLGQLPAGPAALIPRGFHSASWDGSRMLVFGGESTMTSAGPPPTTTVIPDGDAYLFDPSGMMWNTSTSTPPAPRWSATGLWDPTSMQTVVWGGFNNTAYLQDGAVFSSATSMWNSIGGGGTLPEGRVNHSSAILKSGTKSQLVIFGGYGGTAPFGILGTAWSLDITSSMWTAIPAPGPSARQDHTAVANGSTMIIWGGSGAGGYLADGAIYTAP